MEIVQVVKNYGLVGGMEEYVFRLTEELATKNIPVTVLCERQVGEPSSDTRVVEFGQHRKPHWISHFRFSSKVDRWLRENPSKHRVVHSHERQRSHQVTTFHTTPFNYGRKKTLIHRISPRHLLFEKLEKRELMGPNVKAIVPVSGNLSKALEQKHPRAKPCLHAPIFPGVAFATGTDWTRSPVEIDDGTIGFIGKEWKRKGLPKVIEVWRELKKKRPNLKLRIAGVRHEDIAHLIGPEEQDVEILGWIEDKEAFYRSIDLLFHPANKEAFGMIIAEAMTAGVPVLCSTECGASDLVSEAFGIHLPLSSVREDWTNSLSQMLCGFSPKGSFSRPWEQVAMEYLKIYRQSLS